MKTIHLYAILLFSSLLLWGCDQSSSETSADSTSIGGASGTVEQSTNGVSDNEPETNGGPAEGRSTGGNANETPGNNTEETDRTENDSSGTGGETGTDGPMITLLTGETTRGFSDGTGQEARFQGITCMTIAPDGSALYISDTFNGIVRRIDTRTGEVETIGGKALSFSTSDGTGELVRFTAPRGIGITTDGNLLWLADGPALRSLDLLTGEAMTWAGLPGEPGFVDGDAVEARLGYLIHDVDVSDDGNTVILSDRSNDRIRIWDVENETLTTLAGGGQPGADGVGAEVGFNGNGGIVRDGTQLYIADTFSNTLRQLDLSSGEVVTVAGKPGQPGNINGDLSTGLLDMPQGVGLKNGVLYAGGFDGQLRTVDLTTSQISTLPLTGLTGTFSPPVAAPDATRLYYADLSTEAVLSIDLDTNTVTSLAGPVQPEGNIDGSLGEARFGWIYGLEADSAGERVYVADPGNQAVRVIDLANGQVTRITHESWETPIGLALDEAGQRLFVGDGNTGQLWTVALADNSVTALGIGGLGMPWGLAFAGDTLFVAEHTGLQIQGVDVATGETTVLTGTGIAGSADGPLVKATFQGPLGLAWDDTSETLYVADFSGNTVRAIDVAQGIVTTVAGDGNEGSADGLPGGLFQPSGVILRNGQLLITDTGNHTVRSWSPETGLSTILGQAGAGASIGPGSGVPASEATLTLPEALIAGKTGLYISVEYSVMHVPWEAFDFEESP